MGTCRAPIRRTYIPSLVPLASSERLRPEFRRQSTIILPEVVFDCDPRPQAFTIVQERGLVQVNSGFFLTAVMLARTISWLLDLMDSSERFTIDELLSILIPTHLNAGTQPTPFSLALLGCHRSS